jgi:AhpD family alkylhydroperoxidase
MKSRIDLATVSPQAYKAVAGLEHYISNVSGLPKSLIHLIKLRASVINGCAFCVDMHAKEARRDGHNEQWINLVSVWHEAAVYSDKERAVLAWTDAVTRIADTGAPDADFQGLKAHFSDEEIMKITVAIGTINVWNRLAVGFRAQHPVDAPAKAA